MDLTRCNIRRTVVVVDDDESMRQYLSETLVSGGYATRLFPHSIAAIEWLASTEEHIDLLLSDVNMPGMSGLDLLRTVKTVSPDLPFVLISGLCDLPVAKGALRAGATDYLLKPVRPADLLELVAKHLEKDLSPRLEAVRLALKKSLGACNVTGADQDRHLLPIFDALGLKRFETLQHSRRVAAFSLLIARDLRMSQSALMALEVGSLLHDIGKAGIPHNVLMKPGKLNDDEWAIMKMHPRLGLELLRGIPDLNLESQIVYSHHERFDGTGYPDRLSGESIPLSARIFSLADTLDALTSDRCYRTGVGLAGARAEIRQSIGSQFDPAIFNLFDKVPDREFEKVREAFPDF